MANIKTLPKLKWGESGVVVEIHGGFGLVRNLESLGVRVGKSITKISSQIWGGPQVIKIGNTQIAIGFGMARRIFVEVKE